LKHWLTGLLGHDGPIPYGRQSISFSDVRAVAKTLLSPFLTQGPMVEVFEEKINEYVGSQHSVAVNSATSALHLACLAVGVEAGDRVWTSAVTFVASSNCALYCGAEVDFVDINEETYNMSVPALRTKLEAAQRSGTLPKVVIPVHLAGQSCEMSEIWKLGQEFGFKIIEDASHAIGGRYKGNRIGNCDYSDITVFSFHPVKIITTGEGGIATTNDPELARVMRSQRSHGITRDIDEMVSPLAGPWHYEQLRLGFNYRMSDIAAALGVSQLAKIEGLLKRRHKIANYYFKALSGHQLRLPFQNSHTWSSFHLFIIGMHPHIRTEVIESLLVRGVSTNLHYTPVYRHPFYARQGFNPSDFPVAERYYTESLSIPMYPSMSQGEVRRVVRALTRALA
jgi:UDP-4-amino-4,6-dideoxy-N-acetyl-beta-L-altrosamine transaminase